MYLGNLSIKEKYCFLELADKLINADGESKINEQALFTSYSKEMGLKKDYDIQGIDINSILESITNTQSQKIIYLELLALCGIDSDYNIKEKELMQQIATGFGLPQKYVIDCEHWVEEMNNVYRKGHILIFD